MKNILFALLIATTVASCTKEAPQANASASEKNTTTADNPTTVAAMKSIDLHNISVEQNQSFQLDLNADGVNDFIFSAGSSSSNILEFTAASSANSMLLTDANNNAVVLSQQSPIYIFPVNASWDIDATILLARFITPGEGGDSYWEGGWQNMQHKYMGLQIMKDNKLYAGWIEMTMDCTNKRLILHKAGISKVAQADVKAGA